jgi:hypothetical protein
MVRNVDCHGDDHYLAGFADRRWAGEEITHRHFAVAVDHEAQINIHQQLRARVRV